MGLRFQFSMTSINIVLTYVFFLSYEPKSSGLVVHRPGFIRLFFACGRAKTKMVRTWYEGKTNKTLIKAMQTL
jgi:hypothetical protein